MKMNEITVETLFEKAQNFSDSTIELYGLKAIDKSANLVASLTARMLFIIVVSFFFINLNIGLALWLGEKFGKVYFGFLAFSIFYAFIAIFLLPQIYGKLKKQVRNEFIETALKETNLTENPE